MISVYSTSICPKCIMVKHMLKSKGLEYKEFNVEDESVLAELISEGITVSSVPIVKKDSKYYYGIDEIAKAITIGAN